MNILPTSVVSGFDYFGAGNIGDDLMMAGFIDGLNESGLFPAEGLFGFTNWNEAALTQRFPEVKWHHRFDYLVAQNAWPRECWAGVGDTPLQFAVGDWLLKYWQGEMNYLRSFRRRILVNIGAESEIKPRIPDFAAACRDFDAISTRDEHTYRIVTEWLQFPREKTFLASDLAHITLRRLYPHASRKTRALGFILTGDTLQAGDVAALRAFVIELGQRAVFLANVANRKIDSEINLHARLGRRFWPLDRFRRVCKLWIPDYQTGSVEDLVGGVASCETVLSSRYHGLLIAAWAGCRVAAVGRSSKVVALADELGIPCCKPPLTAASIREVFDRAQVVPRQRLEPLADRALGGVRFVMNADNHPNAAQSASPFAAGAVMP